MPTISKKASILLSMILSLLFEGLLAGVALFLPRLVDGLWDKFPLTTIDDVLTPGQRAGLLACLYGLLAVAALAVALLFALLLRVRRGEVFTAKSVSLIRSVSWCCMLLAAGIFAVGWVFSPAVFSRFVWSSLALAALLLGLCLRVVKNVIEQAVAIKSENDLTI